jgi:hypothetical protein
MPMADPSSRRRRVKGGRSPTGGHAREPGRHRRQPDARHHRQGRQGLPTRPGRRKALDFVGKAPLVGHSVGFDIAFLEEALGDGTRIAQGAYLDTLVIAREGYPDLENYKLGTLAKFFGVELSENHRALPDAEATANLLIWFADPQRSRAQPGSRRRPRHTGGKGRDRLEAARRTARFSKSLFGLVQKKTVRTSCCRGLRMDGRATDEIRPISVDVGLLPRARLRPDPGADHRHARRVLGRPAHRHDQPEDREALHPPLQLPPVFHG